MRKENEARPSRRHLRERLVGRRAALAALALALCLAGVAGGTLAWLLDRTETIQNSFQPSHVDCEVVEDSFAGLVKTGVTVKNTSDIEAYIRVRLVTYRVNAEGQTIGGEAAVPAFTPGAGWVKSGEYYYYTKPVAPGAEITPDLMDTMTLADYGGGEKQALEILAEAIQSEPARAAGEAWGVTIAENSVTPYPGN